uniref:SGNH hydrolase-type esterase domain-containing protein n=1 Tax=Anas zonorhyncha TaxID=75864 RepID=A0A8B9TZX8_9AVES
MVSTRHGALCRRSVHTQTEYPLKNAAVQVTGCRECQSLFLPSAGGRDAACVRCEQVDDLIRMVAELKEEVERLRAIRECEREIDWWSNSLQGLKERYRGETPQMGVEPLPCRRQAEGGDLGVEEEWKQVPARHRRRCPPLPTPPSQVPLQNRFEALENERSTATEEEVESVPRRIPRVRRSTPRIRTASTKNERRVIVVGDSVLRGTEGPICRPDPTRREVCCLPGARVRDIAKKVKRLVRPTDYYPLLVFQAGSDEVAKRSPKAIKRDFRDLGRQLRGSGAQVVFASVLPIGGMEAERCAVRINSWLRDWCDRHNFGFFDHGKVYATPGLMAPDGMGLSRRGVRILGQELAGLIDRALN